MAIDAWRSADKTTTRLAIHRARLSDRFGAVAGSPLTRIQPSLAVGINSGQKRLPFTARGFLPTSMYMQISTLFAVMSENSAESCSRGRVPYAWSALVIFVFPSASSSSSNYRRRMKNTGHFAIIYSPYKITYKRNLFLVD